MNPGESEPRTQEASVAPVQQINVGPQPPTAGTPIRQRAGMASIQQFSGPMPPPVLLREYEDICPGSADRMLRMAEQEAEHRRKTESEIISAQQEYSNKQFAEARFGQVCALVITIAALIGGVYTAVNGHEIAGGIIGVGGIGGIVTTFILGRHTESEPKNNAPEDAPSNNSNRVKKKKRR